MEKKVVALIGSLLLDENIQVKKNKGETGKSGKKKSQKRKKKGKKLFTSPSLVDDVEIARKFRWGPSLYVYAVTEQRVLVLHSDASTHTHTYEIIVRGGLRGTSIQSV